MSVLAWIAMAIGALLGLAVTLSVVIVFYELWRTGRHVSDHIERTRQHRQELERYVHALSSAAAERHVVIPIDAENDEEAWAAITRYRRAA